MTKKKVIILISALVIILALVVWIIWGNSALELNKYVITDDEIPASFDGYRIAQVSDLHNTEMGNSNEKLLSMLDEAEPDIIAITGDIIDSRRTDVDVALQFAEEAVKIAPCYYVTGNHESRVPVDYGKLKAGLINFGVTVLENEGVLLKQGKEELALYGVNDPCFYTDYLSGYSATIGASVLKSIADDKYEYKILLSHRPELFDDYVENDIDLILSGHAHGGQIRLPLVGGLFAPGQGLFPEYDAGLYTEKDSNMIVSRGIGNSLFPFRFNNPPEVIVIELSTES